MKSSQTRLVHTSLRLAFLIFAGLTITEPGVAQVSQYQEQGKLVRAPQALTVLGQDLFGDKINVHTGSLEFVQTDVSLPGNSSLPVAMGRRLVTGTTPTDGTSFGRWDMDIPHLHGIFAAAAGWAVAGLSPQLRCSQFGAPSDALGSFVNNPAVFRATEFWHGNFIYVPGLGDEEMLRRNPSNGAAPGGTPTRFPVVTHNNWQFSCLPSMAYGGGGEAFVALAPDGTSYRFDWMVSRPLMYLTKSNPAPDPMGFGKTRSNGTKTATSLPMPDSTPADMNLLRRAEIWILPTLVTDRFGNTVTYTYDQTNRWQLKSIVANDASGSPRRLDITYASATSPLISTVSDGTRTWRYYYTDGTPHAQLTTVMLPDGSSWQLTGIYSLVNNIEYGSGGGCEDGGSIDSGPVSGFLVHPSGARGTFTLTPTRHGRSGVPNECYTDGATMAQTARYPRTFDTYAVTRKEISGPGLSSMVWTTTYPQAQSSWAPCNGCVSTATVEVKDPEGNVTKHIFGTLFHENEGMLQETDVLDKQGNLVRTTRLYYTEPIAPLGTSDQGRGDGVQGTRMLETNRRVMQQQGVTFTWEASAFDGYARPTAVTRSSSLGYRRSETTKYNNNTAKWVLGQTEQVTEQSTGLIKLVNYYNPVTANLETVTKFGKLQQSLSYNSDGTLYTRKDAGNHTTTYIDYKRGIPRTVRFADNTSESATVDDIGLIRTVTNAAGYTTTYDYDAIGRLQTINYPANDTVAWNRTQITYTQSPVAEYGLAAGHWREDVITGNAADTTYYDALWRPVYTERWDQADRNGTVRVVRKQFDSAGHKTFESYPARSYSLATDGVYQAFDPLGRPTVTSTISELGTLYSGFAYINGFQKVYTDARQHNSTYTYQVFDEADESAITNIYMPEGVNIAVNRDIFGKPKSITRSGNGKSVTRSYVYDSAQRLCKTIEPETKSTVQDYDVAGNLAWRAPGLALPSTTSCDTSSAPATKKISYGYDVLNRLRTTTFGDGSPAITQDYTPDGLLNSITSGGATWINTYNHRRLNEKERLTYGGVNYDFDRQYDANASLLRVRYPQDSTWLEYGPNALGEARLIGNYASFITYHPNGAITSFYYGNGILHSMQPNRRGLPETVQDAGVLKDQYTYDANGNVTSIADLQEGVTSRGLEYDNLNRLIHASSTGIWGDARYTYDALDNMTSSKLTTGTTARTLTHTINSSTNLLDSISNSSGSAYNLGFQYDDQGNVKQRGAQTFVFDLGNRMKSATGKGTYTYDGFGHRVSVVGPDGVNRVTVYSQEGKLLYVKATNASVGTKYIHLHNHVIAEVTGSSVQYDHTDGLGSPIAFTDGTKHLTGRTRYEPYGVIAAGITPVVGYTGHLNAADLGLVYMQQRYYDPVAGRFLSTDPVMANSNTGGSFNRYAYAANSPYKYIDPDGREIVISGSEKFRQRVINDLRTIKSGKNGAQLVTAAEKTSSTIKIVQSTDGTNNTTAKEHFFGNGHDAKIEYNPDKKNGGRDEKGNKERPAYVGLGHELGHAVAMVQGQQSYDMGSGKPGTTPPSEQQSMKAENGIRADHNLPLRKNYYEQ